MSFEITLALFCFSTKKMLVCLSIPRSFKTHLKKCANPKLILPKPGSNPTDSNLIRSGSSYASPLGRVAMGVGLDFDDERELF